MGSKVRAELMCMRVVLSPHIKLHGYSTRMRSGGVRPWHGLTDAQMRAIRNIASRLGWSVPRQDKPPFCVKLRGHGNEWPVLCYHDTPQQLASFLLAELAKRNKYHDPGAERVRED